MSIEEFLKKNQGLGLSKALAREHLSQAGLKSTKQLPIASERLAPLRDALSRTISAKAPAGLSRRLVKNLAGA